MPHAGHRRVLQCGQLCSPGSTDKPHSAHTQRRRRREIRRKNNTQNIPTATQTTAITPPAASSESLTPAHAARPWPTHVSTVVPFVYTPSGQRVFA
jgi:hypothetical protein